MGAQSGNCWTQTQNAHDDDGQRRTPRRQNTHNTTQAMNNKQHNSIRRGLRIKQFYRRRRFAAVETTDYHFK